MKNFGNNISYKLGDRYLMIIADYHIHSRYSHGIGTILENAENAQKKGLKEIAITDHGFGHSFFSMKHRDIPKIRADIDEAQKKTEIKIYFGIEANFISTTGEVDISQSDLQQLDIVLVGHHRFVESSLKDKFTYLLPNIVLGRYVSERVKQKNTAITLAAMEKYPIDILTHLNYQFPIDVRQVAKKAKQTHTFFELNEYKVNFLSPSDFEILIEEKVDLVINSDAHCPKRIGCFRNALEAVEKYKVPKEQIVNWDKVPIFKKFNKDLK
ncbi:MAG: PHP domain-containing protein [Clostridia bacterium]|nr:PHP domain-containing protein [Clostridia bacterium]